jgi:hypothetical protein
MVAVAMLIGRKIGNSNAVICRNPTWPSPFFGNIRSQREISVTCLASKVPLQAFHCPIQRLVVLAEAEAGRSAGARHRVRRRRALTGTAVTPASTGDVAGRSPRRCIEAERAESRSVTK